MKCRDRSVQRGIALMLVLWVIALLTVIAVGVTATQRTESSLAGNQLATARFRAVADAGVIWAVIKLLAPPAVFDEEADSWAPDGTARPWTFAGESLEIRVSNEASRIDLNTASRDLLGALFSAAGYSRDEASALADIVEDWRDENDLSELNGAEDDDYEDAGRSYGAKDGPFDSVEELQLMLGIDRDLFRTLAPAITVSSGVAEVVAEFAPPLVQAAVEGITLEEAELEEEQRKAVAESDGSAVVSLNRGGPIYRIHVTQKLERNAGRSMEALVNTQTEEGTPFEVLWRRFGLISEASDPSAGDGDGGGEDF